MPQEVLDNPYGQKPQDVATPMPIDNMAVKDARQDRIMAAATPDEDLSALEAEFSSIMPTSTEEGSIGSIEQELQAALQDDTDYVALNQEMNPGMFGSEVGPNITAGSPKKTFVDRIQASFGRTDDERESYLVGKYGNENVQRIKKGEGDDSFKIRKPGTDKFITVDPEHIDIMGDFFADGARDIFVGGGAAVGFALGGGLASPLTATAGAIIMSSAFDAAADFYAERVLGINRDPIRGGIPADDSLKEQANAVIDRVAENMTTGLVTGVMEAGGQGLAHAAGFGQTVGPGKQALKKIRNVKSSTQLKGTVPRAVEVHDRFVESGMIQTIPGTNVAVTIDQLIPESAEHQALVKAAEGSKDLAKARLMGHRNVEDAIDNVVTSEFGLQRGSFMNAAIQENVTQHRGSLQQQIKAQLAKQRKEEGAIIGKYRRMAGKKGDTTPMSMQHTSEALLQAEDGLFARLGIMDNEGRIMLDSKGNIKFPDEDTLVTLLGAPKAQANTLKNNINMMFKEFQASGGKGLKWNRIEYYKNVFRSALDSMPLDSRQKYYHKAVGELAVTLRKDSIDGMADILGRESVEFRNYQAAIKPFRDTIDAQATIRNLLKENDIANQSFVKGLVTAGKKGLPQVQAVKQALLKQDPELWNKVVGEFIEQIAIKHATPAAKGTMVYDAAGIKKEFITKYGEDYLTELMVNGRRGYQNILDILHIGERIDQAVAIGDEQQTKKMVQESIQLFSSFRQAKMNALHFFARLGIQDKTVLKLMEREGLEEFLKKVPEAEKGRIRGMLEFMVRNGLRTGSATGKAIKTTSKAKVTGKYGKDAQEGLRDIFFPPEKEQNRTER